MHARHMHAPFMHMARRTVGRIAGALAPAFAVAVAALTIASPARAQFGEAAGIGELMQQEFIRRDLKLFEQALRLDETQRTIAETLYHDYEDAFKVGIAGLHQKFEDMRPELSTLDEKRIMTLVFRPFEEWADERHELGVNFLDSVRVTLTEEQLEMWPEFRRRLTREKTLHRGRLSGESTDLTLILREMEIGTQLEQKLQPVLTEYSVALDAALAKRNAAMIGSDNRMLRALAEQDPDKRMDEMVRQIGLRTVVRDVNDRFIDEIAAQLPSDLAAEFRAQALEKGYSRIFRPTPVQNLFKAAKVLEGVEPAIVQAISGVEQNYLAELAGVNQQLLATVRQHEPDEMKERARAFELRMQGQTVEPAADPARDLLVQRDEISRDYARQLQALLTPEQFAQLPGGYRWADNPEQEKPENVQTKPLPRTEANREAKQQQGEQESEEDGGNR